MSEKSKETFLRETILDLYRMTWFPISFISCRENENGRENILLFPTGEDAEIIPMEEPFTSNPDLTAYLRGTCTASGFISAIVEDKEFAGIYYGVLLNDDSMVILGPFTTSFFSEDSLRKYMLFYHMHDFVNYFIPNIALTSASSFLTLLHQSVTGSRRRPAMVTNNNTSSEASPHFISEYTASDYTLKQNEQNAHHLPYRTEQALMGKISAGEDYDMNIYYNNLKNYNIGTMSHSAVKQAEYAAVIGTALFARAAIDGGVNPYIIFNLNDLYLQQISEIRHAEKYFLILKEACHAFTAEVKKANNNSAQPLPIKKSKQYIALHLNSPIRLQDLSDHAGVTPGYLSALFSEKEKITIKEYILRERIRAAKNMLRFSDCTISQISDSLCFSSQSHFGSVFRRLTGETPSEYRRRQVTSN